jgi:hypothetical protein
MIEEIEDFLTRQSMIHVFLLSLSVSGHIGSKIGFFFAI